MEKRTGYEFCTGSPAPWSAVLPRSGLCRGGGGVGMCDEGTLIAQAFSLDITDAQVPAAP
jgi:hypothetical protein